MQDKDTVSSYFVASALARLGPAARERALAAAGIEPAVPGSAAARVPAAAFSELWRAVASELDDEFFGLDRRGMKVGSFGLLCHAVLGASSLEQALRRALRGMRMFLDDIDGELLVEGDEARLVLRNRLPPGPQRLFADEAFLVIIHGLLCWLAGRRIAVDSARFAHPRPPHAREYTRMFCADLRFAQPDTELRLRTRSLARPPVRDVAALREFLRAAPQSIFLRYRNEDSCSLRLRRRLRAVLEAQAEWPRLETLAGELGLAPATLRRRLDAEGNSFRDIKDQLRNDLAIDLLCHSELSVEAIAARLGYREVSAFHRAFRRWNGSAPGEYRLARAR